MFTQRISSFTSDVCLCMYVYILFTALYSCLCVLCYFYDFSSAICCFSYLKGLV